MPANELEYIYNGFSFGQGSASGDAWVVLDTGELGNATMRISRIPKAGADGEWTFAGYLEANDFILAGTYDAPSRAFSEAVDDMFNTFLTAFVPQSSDLHLQFNWGGVAMYIACVPTRVSFDKNQLWSMSVTSWAVEFLAGDPVIHADV